MPNRLHNEASLYLRQHADNLVDWQPWGEAALAQARREGKPILLSIGYSACHWCHVMAHESFEDAATAHVMNALYVCVKVDREERPDLDRIYQLAHQALSRRGGGWPLTVFLAPDDLLPFYAGTYFPPQARHGLPAFVEVLQGVRRWFDTHPAELAQQNAALGEFLADQGRGEPSLESLDDAPLKLALQRIRGSFDAEHGGRRGGPKFPPCTQLELLRRFADADEDAAAMAEHTLRKMAERGLHDHLLGGFFRYCVDAHWGIPHFEKMLYDNAALLGCYADAALEGDLEYVAAAEGIARWLQRDMRVQDGGLASAMDADSEGEEGAYYLWTPSQVLEALPASPRRLAFAAAYGLDAQPNFEGHAWHLLRERPLEETADFTLERAALLAVRDARVSPARDDKQLTAWNAMAIRALARASRQLKRPDWLALAVEILDAIRTRAWRAAPSSPSSSASSAAANVPATPRRPAPTTFIAPVFGQAAAPASTTPMVDESIASMGFIGMAEEILSAAILAPMTEMSIAPDVTSPGDETFHAPPSSVAGQAPLRGRLLAVAGNEELRGYLDDHAFLLDALLERLQTQWCEDDLAWAVGLADTLLDDFEDADHGGFFFTPHDHENLPQRPKPWLDEATPAGNGVAARALLRLGWLIGEPRYLDAAERTLRAGLAQVRDAPHGACSLLTALHEWLSPAEVVVLRASAAEAAAWHDAIAQLRDRGAMAYVLPPEAAWLPEKPSGPGGRAYVCRGMLCRAPADSPAQLILQGAR